MEYVHDVNVENTYEICVKSATIQTNNAVFFNNTEYILSNDKIWHHISTLGYNEVHVYFVATDFVGRNGNGNMLLMECTAQGY